MKYLLTVQILLSRRGGPEITLRDREGPNSGSYSLFGVEGNPILTFIITLRVGESFVLRVIIFEMEETPILRVITFRDRGNSNSTGHYSSRWGKLQFYASLFFEVEETPILPLTLRDGGDSHSTGHYSST